MLPPVCMKPRSVVSTSVSQLSKAWLGMDYPYFPESHLMFPLQNLDTVSPIFTKDFPSKCNIPTVKVNRSMSPGKNTYLFLVITVTAELVVDSILEVF